MATFLDDRSAKVPGDCTPSFDGRGYLVDWLSASGDGSLAALEHCLSDSLRQVIGKLIELAEADREARED